MLDNSPISYILLGQSNGNGADDAFNCPVDFSLKNSNSFIYNVQKREIEVCQRGINSSNEPYEFLNAGLILPRNGKKMGIEIALNQLLVEEYRCKTFLFKYCFNGSALLTAGLYGGTWDYSVIDNCFDKSLYYLFQGIKKTPIKFKKPQFAVWIQWEGDATSHATYAAGLTRMITEYRLRLGYDIIFVIISASTAQTGVTTVDNINSMKTAQKSLAQVVYTVSTGLITTQSGGATLTNVIYIDQNEPCIADNIHYSGASYCNIAEHIFQLRDYLNIL